MQVLKSLAKSSKTSGFRLRFGAIRLRISGFRLRIGGDRLRNRGDCLRIIETEIQFTTEAQRTPRGPSGRSQIPSSKSQIPMPRAQSQLGGEEIFAAFKELDG